MRRSLLSELRVHRLGLGGRSGLRCCWLLGLLLGLTALLLPERTVQSVQRLSIMHASAYLLPVSDSRKLTLSSLASPLDSPNRSALALIFSSPLPSSAASAEGADAPNRSLRARRFSSSTRARSAFSSAVSSTGLGGSSVVLLSSAAGAAVSAEGAVVDSSAAAGAADSGSSAAADAAGASSSAASSLAISSPLLPETGSEAAASSSCAIPRARSSVVLPGDLQL